MSRQNRPHSTGKAGFVFQIIVELVFLVAGAAVLVNGYRAYLQGEPLQQVGIMGGVGAVFILVSLYGLYATWGTWTAHRTDSLRQTHPDAPWRIRPEWRTARFVSERGVDWGLMLFASVWNAIAWPAALYAIYTQWQRPEPDWEVLVIAAFPLVGAGVAWLAVRGWLHRQKFGDTTLQMQTMPARLGTPLQMIIQTGVDREAAPEDGFHVRLTCYRRSIRYTTDSDGDRRREVEKDVLWRDEKRVRGRGYGTAGQLELPVTFTLPADPPPSTPEKRENRIMWEVDVDAEVPGLDFDAAFEIPVFASDTSLPFEEHNSNNGQASRDENRREHRLSADAPAKPYAQYELGAVFTEPVSNGITMERSPGGGLTLQFAAGRNKGLGLLWSGTAVSTGIGTILLLAQSFFGALILALIAGVTGYAAWKTWTTASTLTIERGTVTLVRGPFGHGEPVSFSCTELADVTLRANGQAGRTTFYDLLLHRMDTTSQQQAQARADQADQVAAFLRRSGLVGTGPEADDAMERIKASIHAQSTQLNVATGLSNKQEADWLVTVIQQAAIEEAQFA